MSFDKGDMFAINEGPHRGLGLIVLAGGVRVGYLDVEVVYARGVDVRPGDRLTVEQLPLEARFPDIDRVLASALTGDGADG